MHAQITIDGQTLLNGHVDPDQPKSPIDIAKLLKPGSQPQPGIIALLGAFAIAVKTGQDITIDLTTRPGGYNLTVDHQPILITQ